MPDLFNKDNLETDDGFRINTDYAKNYDNWRQKEELHKFKTKYGEVPDVSQSSNESSDTSSEDEDGVELTAEFEKDFFKTLACLKRKDPKIYQEDVKFFENSQNEIRDNKQKKSKSEKPLFLRDYERQLIVERDGKLSDSEEGNEQKKIKLKPTYAEEQRKIKESFKEVLIDDDNEDDESSLLVLKNQSTEQTEKEEEGYKEWLKGQKADVDEKEQEELTPLRDFWNDPKLDPNEKFLRDYILNKKFLGNDTEVDTDYDHVLHDSDENLSEDENNIEKQEEFEHKYNFRFEEPDQEFIKRYPRTLEHSMRKKDTRRSEKRKELKKRKEEEKIRRQEELKQLKSLKRKEIEAKIEMLKEITGNDDLEFGGIDLEGDFNPEEHDKKMQELFNENYYADKVDENKPEFPDIDKELEIESTWDNYDPNTEQNYEETYEAEPHCEDPDFIMDAEYDPTKETQSELIGNTKKKKRRRRSKFAELISKEKPKFDPVKYKNYEEYFDQYYSLDYEDMIGDIPCRFKYRKVVPNDYGLSVEEILLADDKELNRWCSLKSALQYKSDQAEWAEVKKYKQKSQNENLKRKILPSLYRTTEETEEDATTNNINKPESSQPNNEQKKKKKKKKNVSNENIIERKEESNEHKSNEENTHIEKELSSPKSKKKKISNENIVENKVELSQNKLEQDTCIGKEPNSSKSKKKKRKVNAIPNKNDSGNNSVNEEQIKKGIKKRKNSGNAKEEPRTKKKKQMEDKKNIAKNATDSLMSVPDSTLAAFGLNPKKFKNKLKYGKKK